MFIAMPIEVQVQQQQVEVRPAQVLTETAAMGHVIRNYFVGREDAMWLLDNCGGSIDLPISGMKLIRSKHLGWKLVSMLEA